MPYKNKEVAKEYSRKYYQEHKDVIKARVKKHSEKYAKKHPEKVKEWRIKSAGKVYRRRKKEREDAFKEARGW